MARNDRVTFMTPEDFTNNMERVFGRGWTRTAAEALGSNQTTMSHYGSGVDPVPKHMALISTLMAYALDNGQAVTTPQPIGTIVDRQMMPLPAEPRVVGKPKAATKA